MEFTTGELLVAYLTHDLDFRAILFNMIVKLSSRHHLRFLPVANITAKFGTVELRVSLQFTKSLPYNVIGTWAFMRELTEINTVLDDFVDWSQEVTTALAIRAANIVVRSVKFLVLMILFWFLHWRFITSSINW